MATFKVGDLIKPTGNGSERAINTQLTGSNTEEIVLWDSYAITTTDKILRVLTSEEMGKALRATSIQIMFTNTHDQPISLRAQNLNRDIRIIEGASSFTIPANLQSFYRYVVTSDEWDTLKIHFSNLNSFTIQCTEAPTTGVLLLSLLLKYN